MLYMSIRIKQKRINILISILGRQRTVIKMFTTRNMLKNKTRYLYSLIRTVIKI